MRLEKVEDAFQKLQIEIEEMEKLIINKSGFMHLEPKYFL